MRVEFGRDVLRRPMEFDPLDGHLIISSATGGGKTSLGRSILLSLADMCYSAAVLNPKVVGYAALKPLMPVYTDPADFTKVLIACVDEMRRRYLDMERAGVGEFEPAEDRPRFCLLIEEVAAITSGNGSKRDRDAFLLALSQFSNMARGAGMLLVLVVQSADSATLGQTVVRANCATRVAMRNGFEQQKMIIGDDEEALARSRTVTMPGELLAFTPARGWVQGKSWDLSASRCREVALEMAARRTIPRLPPFLDFSRSPAVPGALGGAGA